MKKIDLHIHTVSTVSDSDFTFSIDTLKKYIEKSKLDVIAITNHNIFDLTQFKIIESEISIVVFPGIEIDLPSGHLLVISDGKDLDLFNEKCNKVSDKIKSQNDSITIEDFKTIFGDLSQYLLIPHYEKFPEVRNDDFNKLKDFFSAGEVDNPKKFIRNMKDKEKLCPVLFSDERMKEGLINFPTRQTFLDCGEITLAAIKSTFKDRTKVFLSENDGNKLFQVFDNGQHISTGLNVILGKRSSGKTYTLNQLENAFDRVKYIRQFDLVQRNEEDDDKNFKTEVQRKRGLFVDKYLESFKTMIDDISQINLINDERQLTNYIESLLKSAEEVGKKDAFSKVKLFEEEEFQISSNDGLKKLIDSVIYIIENKEYESLIEEYIEKEQLRSLATNLISRLWNKTENDKNKNHINSLVKDIKDNLRFRTSSTPVESVDLFNILLNKKRITKFNTITKAMQEEVIIFDEPIQGFRVVAKKLPFKLVGEFKDTIRRQVSLKDSFEKYNNPFEFLQSLKDNDKLENSDYHRLFVRIQYLILNKDGNEVSGGERSEFRLLQEIKDAQNYDLLLLDEPESSFDNKFLNSDVNDLIKSISKEMPVVVVTHNNTVGLSIKPDYILYNEKTNLNGEIIYRLFSGYPTDFELVCCVDGTKVKNYDVLLNSLEAGYEAYQYRGEIYNDVKN
ncbi:PHP domain-containing protein [Aliarcobacter butzleri]|uniref:PHP domain-containing protein n=1 Tax=Aliarcobacter butzleri TaxID=28197 RepID=UPI001EE0F614|nr:PHP domain-containing protein [Aliarcobacter butzleri]MCG3703799.1 PHP domain-containing protein [Aliarcobacter butzleri]